MSVRVLSAILDTLAACARIVFEVGLALAQWNLEGAKEARRKREDRQQDHGRK